MAPESSKKSVLASMETKQKIMVVVVIIIFLIIIWQVMQMFGSSSSATVSTPAASPAAMSNSSPNATPTVANSTNTAATVSPTIPTPQQQTIKNSMLPETSFLAAQKEAQDKYLSELNKLQLLRIQREISETDQAIAVAKLAKVKAETDMTMLITKPQEPTQFPGAYSNLPQVNTQIANSTNTPPPTFSPQMMAPPQDAQYLVVSVSMEMNRWTAVLGAKGKIFTVGIGDVLPIDGATVVSINKNGVVLKTREGIRKRISMIGSI